MDSDLVQGEQINSATDGPGEPILRGDHPRRDSSIACFANGGYATMLLIFVVQGEE